MNHCRKLWIAVLAITLLSTAAFADGLELKPYGFIKGDMVYASQGVLSFGNLNLLAPQRADASDDAALGMTAQHSRFGLKGTTGEETKVGGLVELDFFTGAGYNANASPRIRLAYAWINNNNFEFRVGQQWDLFSPNNPMTNNTNGNLWFNGNMGFRRPQFQAMYSMPQEGFTPTLQLALCEGAREEVGLGADNYSTMPMVQGRLSGKFDKHVVGVYFAYASFSPLSDSTDLDFTASGFGADFNLPFHKLLALSGEVNMGTNLNNANLFTIAGNGAKDVDRKNLGFWFNALSKPHKFVHVVLGVGMDQNQTDDKYMAAGMVESNMAVYGNVTIPFTKNFSMALELENITTSFKDGDDESAMILDVAGKVTF